MGYDLQHLRLRHGVSLDQMTEVGRELYPRLDKQTLSKTMNAGYGVDLKRDALRLIAQRFDPEGWAKLQRKRDGHKLQRRVQCRLTEFEYDAFVARYKADGYPNANVWMREAILRYLREV